MRAVRADDHDHHHGIHDHDARWRELPGHLDWTGPTIGQGKDQFLTTLTGLAQQNSQKTGIDPAAYLAIAANETGWGQSQTAQQQNNLFSIQGTGANGSRWAGYDTPQASFDAFNNLISTAPRYAQAWADRANPSKFVDDLRNAGYVVDEPGFPAQGWVNQVKSIYSDISPRVPQTQTSAPTDASTPGGALMSAPPGNTPGKPLSAPDAQSAAGGPSGQEWYRIAQAQLSKPYIWGSAGGRSDFSTDAAGFDCSGFVSYVMKTGFGVDLPAYTGSAYTQTRALKPGEEPRPGDVVFYNMDSSDPHEQHIALYTGNGQIDKLAGVAQLTM